MGRFLERALAKVGHFLSAFFSKMLAFFALFSDFFDIFEKNHLRNDDFLYYREMVNKGVILIMFLVKIGQ